MNALETRWADMADEAYEDETRELPDTCLNRIDGHWYVVTYGRAPYQIHAEDCETCETCETCRCTGDDECPEHLATDPTTGDLRDEQHHDKKDHA